MRDSFNRFNPRPVIAPAVVADNTAQVGAIIDKQGYGSLTYVINTGVLADADATFAVTLQEGNTSNLADAATVAATDMLGSAALASFDFTADGKALKLGYIGSKRYTRLTITPANNTGNAPVSAIAILGDAGLGPTTNPPN
jgi:hypothetical protein